MPRPSHSDPLAVHFNPVPTEPSPWLSSMPFSVILSHLPHSAALGTLVPPASPDSYSLLLTWAPSDSLPIDRLSGSGDPPCLPSVNAHYSWAGQQHPAEPSAGPKVELPPPAHPPRAAPALPGQHGAARCPPAAACPPSCSAAAAADRIRLWWPTWNARHCRVWQLRRGCRQMVGASIDLLLACTGGMPSTLRCRSLQTQSLQPAGRCRQGC